MQFGNMVFQKFVASKMIQIVLITYFLEFTSKIKDTHIRNFFGNIWNYGLG